MISVVDLSHTFHGRGGTIEALRRVTLHVAEGEFVAVVGRSGCGKSTLLRLVAGLLDPTSGQVHVDGTPVTGPRRDIALMSQRPALLPWRSVLDNVLLPAEVLHLPKADYAPRAYELLELVGLRGFEGKLPHELSGGMAQRAALCRCLLTQPRLMLMDEPFSALDVLTREELSMQLQRIHTDLSATVLFVTHAVNEAVLLADRVVVLTERPGQVHSVIDIEVPRPRTLGHHTHSADMALLATDLHERLRPASTRANRLWPTPTT